MWHRGVLKRMQLIQIVENIPKHQRVYIDESGIDKFIYRPLGCILHTKIES